MSGSPDAATILDVILLMGAANGAPVLATRLLAGWFDTPLDGGLRMPDGRPVFGASKTLRGLIASVAATTALAVVLGLHWSTGVGFAAASMAGDLFSSFVKRRLGLELHSQALGLDQIPEALLPMLLLRARLGLSPAEIAVALVAFVVAELTLSRLLYWLNIRDRPY
jgi:CDP-2,3-bis-(O-geranylgeranyl)-sn-glycerol synthase